MARKKDNSYLAIKFPPTTDESEDDIARELVRVLCTYRGRMTVNSITAALGPQRCQRYFAGSSPEILLSKYPQLFKLEGQQHATNVTLTTNVRICPTYGTKGGCNFGHECQNLHVCKFYSEGKCRFVGAGSLAGPKAKMCLYSHNYHDSHNHRILESALLDKLTEKQIQMVITQSCMKKSVPKVCSFYNVEVGCGRGSNCAFLHVCKHYILGDCAFTNANRKDCKRSHNIYDSQPKALLNKFGIETCQSPKEVLKMLREMAIEKAELPPTSPKSPTTQLASNHILDKDAYICTYFVRGKCNFRNACKRHHYDMPYIWQRSRTIDTEWVNFEPELNENIEKAFCEAANTNVSVFDGGDVQWVINFDNMAAINDIDTSVTLGLRRLSTWSTGRAPTGHLFATHWTWSWQDEYNQWIKYGEKSGSSSIDSDQLEKEYQNYLDKTAEGIVSFTSGHHKYILQFKTMQQQNTKYKTKRAVRRRPKFMSRDDVQDIIRQGPSRPTCTGSTTVAVAAAKGSSTYYVPDHWDLTGDDYGDYRLVDIHPTGKTAREYNDVTTKFYKTIPRTTRITRIVRVQNEELWDHHTRKERWMMKKNMDRKVEERHLFHGTRHEFVDAICQQNFDWRVSGTSSGTAYGKGSYFARDATYSHNYTRPDTNGIYQMFLARVLVGSYTAGNEDLVKPPPKNPSNPFGDSYDSCVNSTSDPSIYIIFDNSQTYPQYVISYK